MKSRVAVKRCFHFAVALYVIIIIWRMHILLQSHEIDFFSEVTRLTVTHWDEILDKDLRSDDTLTCKLSATSAKRAQNGGNNAFLNILVSKTGHRIVSPSIQPVLYGESHQSEILSRHSSPNCLTGRCPLNTSQLRLKRRSSLKL